MLAQKAGEARAPIRFIPSLLRDLVERDFSVSFFELTESEGLFCSALAGCGLLGVASELPTESRVSVSLALLMRPFASTWLAGCLVDGSDDSAFVLVIHAAAIPLVDDVPIPRTQWPQMVFVQIWWFAGEHCYLKSNNGAKAYLGGLQRMRMFADDGESLMIAMLMVILSVSMADRTSSRPMRGETKRSQK